MALLKQNLARTTVAFEKSNLQSDANRSAVLLPCPRSFKGQCQYVPHMWSCQTCHHTLRYAYDDYFYCACGKAPVKSYQFKCNSSYHGESFEPFNEAADMDLPKMKSLREINILILGETGVGKSTWINAFTNYVSYATFEEAESGPLMYAIPSYHVVQSKKIFIGTKEEKDQLECQKTTSSVTQHAAAYVFKYRDLAIRLIDTPGIGDTRGLDADKANLQNILDHLAHYDKLHGICILLPANQARLTVYLKFCITELLRQLHRDACRNIVFCFTRTRGSDFGPGDTLGTLEVLIKEFDLPLELNEDTIYCIDDEAVLFIYALRNGISANRGRAAKVDSWNQSVAETSRLVQYVMSKEPHQLKKTLSLNESRRIIVTLCRGPLVIVSAAIQENIEKLQEKQERLSKGIQHQLSRDVGTELVVYKHVPLSRPRIVCKSSNCSLVMHDTSQHGGNRICCDECSSPVMMLCVKTKLWSHRCKVCGCHDKDHEWVTFTVEKVLNTEADIQQGDENDCNSKRRSVNSEITELVTTVKKEENEQKIILEVAAKLAYFLRKNSLVSRDDIVDEYMQFQQIVTAEEDRARLQLLQENYTKNRRDMEDLCKHAESGVKLPETPEEVNELIEKLYKLSMNGRALSEAVEVASASAAAVAYSGDKVFAPDFQKNPKKNNLQRTLNESYKKCKRHGCLIDD